MRFLRKLFSLIPMTVLVASAIAAWFTEYWWLILPGILVSVGIACRSLDEPNENLPEEVTVKTYDVKLLNPVLQERFRSLLKKRDQILQGLDELKDSPFLDLSQVATQVNELADSYYSLVLKLEKLKPFVDKKAIEEAKEYIALLNSRIKTCSDAETRENLTMAQQHKTDELNRLLELQKHHQRIDSQLLNVVSSFNSIYTAIVQIQLSPETSGRPAREIRETVGGLVRDIEISEKVVQELNTTARRGTS